MLQIFCFPPCEFILLAQATCLQTLLKQLLQTLDCSRCQRNICSAKSTFNTRTTGVAICPQRPAAIILTVSRETCVFTSICVVWLQLKCWTNTQVAKLNQSIHKNSFIGREGQKLDTKLAKVSHLHCRKYNSFGKFRGGTLATYSFVELEAKFAGFVLSDVCTYLTLFTFSALVFYELSIVSEV